MKNILSAATIAATLLLATTSCDEKEKLANNITGSWTAAAERIDTPQQPTTTTVTRAFNFNKTTQHGGTVTATALFSVQSGTKLTPYEVQPIATTVNGTATINGSWEATDDDDIYIAYDYSSLQINVDPNEVVLEYDIATETSQPVDSIIKPQLANAIATNIRPVMQFSVFNTKKIDDIKIKGNLLSCEIGKTDYTFHRDM